MVKSKITKLSEDPPNYDAWEFRTRISAEAKGLLATIEGEDFEPTTGHSGKIWKAWKARRDAASEMIVDALEDSQILHVRGLEKDPSMMWIRLRSVHEKTGLTAAIAVWKEFHSLKYTDPSVLMRTHIGLIRACAERLERLHKDKPSEAQIVARMLSSLPPSYSTLIKILDGDPNGNDVDYVAERILSEEISQKDEAKEAVAQLTTSAFHAQTTIAAMYANRPPRSQLVCENPVCKTVKRTGHVLAECFWPGGGKEGQWPEWWFTKKSGDTTPVPPMAGLARMLQSGDVISGRTYSL